MHWVPPDRDGQYLPSKNEAKNRNCYNELNCRIILSEETFEMTRRSSLLKRAIYICIVFLCAISTVALAQFRVVCELGELSHDDRGIHHDHETQESETTHNHDHMASGQDTSQASTATEHASSSASSSEEQESDESCCESTGPTEFHNNARSVSHAIHKFTVSAIAYFVANSLAKSLAATSERKTTHHLAKLTAPPLPIHISTTILRI